MSANDNQVGGTHYKGEYQHWDFVLDAELDYLCGNATKYVARWRKKNGLQDLEKAKHYIQKKIETCGMERGDVLEEYSQKVRDAIVRFNVENNLHQKEGDIMMVIGMYRSIGDLECARDLVDALIKEYSDSHSEGYFLTDSCEWRS